ncbi:MAG: penicillin-binding protein 1C [Saprospiraceae bacterium]|nr:penicillin-binding protein 1C [Candidatus Parvibacillus calidus]
MKWRSQKLRVLIVCAVLLAAFYFILPRKLFNPSYSIILEDRNGILMGARIAADGQWRFPPEGGDDTLSQKYIDAVLMYEDRNFYRHGGVNIRSLARATWQNIKARKIVSGASTVSMQVISLYRGHKARNILDKLWEIILAMRLEVRYSKEEILKLYASHAPFGGNTVGYGAATWRYFGKHNKDLTWAEAALLAVLPNDPALIHPGKNRDRLRLKRDNLLRKLASKEVFDPANLDLYLEEELPDRPYSMPDVAPHLLSSMQRLTGKSYMHSSVDMLLQQRLNDLLANYGLALKANEVNNAAICVADVMTGEVKAYVGNMPGTGSSHGEQVDIIQSSRSTGSLLKPFLAMMAIGEGKLTTRTLLADIPVNIDGFRPDNFTYDFEGAVPLDVALRKSLNIPFVLLLKEYNISRFLQNLRLLGVSRLDKSADHYGLSLIIGGGESSLWELCGTYASCARILNHYNENSSRYSRHDVRPLSMEINKIEYQVKDKSPSVLDAGSIFKIFDVLSENTRPGEYEAWKTISGPGRIAWKTGTSIGFRDAWSIGVNSRYVVGVWIGNADGEGRPGVIGLETAAPLLFKVFDLLPSAPWFAKPFDGLKKVIICRNSGLAPNDTCPKDTMEVPKHADMLALCTYDRSIALDKTGSFRVSSECYSPFQMVFKNYFLLPPAQQYYYSSKHPSYNSPPMWFPGCDHGIESRQSVMQFIYPNNIRKLKLPRDANGKLNPVTFVVAHKDHSVALFWHLDDRYMGTTKGKHSFSTVLPSGFHTLTVVDEAGISISTSFEAVIVSNND